MRSAAGRRNGLSSPLSFLSRLTMGFGVSGARVAAAEEDGEGAGVVAQPLDTNGDLAAASGSPDGDSLVRMRPSPPSPAPRPTPLGVVDVSRITAVEALSGGGGTPGPCRFHVLVQEGAAAVAAEESDSAVCTPPSGRSGWGGWLRSWSVRRSAAAAPEGPTPGAASLACTRTSGQGKAVRPRDLHLQADTAEDMQRWMRVLATLKAAQPLDPVY